MGACSKQSGEPLAHVSRDSLVELHRNRSSLYYVLSKKEGRGERRERERYI